MRVVTQSRWIPYQSTYIYQILTQPEKLAQVVKRITSVEVIERTNEMDKIRAQLDLPGGKFIDVFGQVEGEVGQYLSFKAEEPFPLQISWDLAYHVQNGKTGTLVTYTIKVDFSAVVAFISNLVLRGYLSAEMKKDLENLENLLAHEFTSA